MASTVEARVPKWVIEEDFEEEVVGVLRSGKEARVWLVRRRRRSDGRWCLLAVKEYLPRHARAFRRDGYWQGRHLLGTLPEGTGQGLASFRAGQTESYWTRHEANVQTYLWHRGVRVPYPLGSTERGFAMQYIGQIGRPAPRLTDVRPTVDQATRWFHQLLREVRLMLEHYIVHADLSPYNVLIWSDKLWIIDFPQAVDITGNADAPTLFARDLRNICGFFAKHGVEEARTTDPVRLLGPLSGAVGAWIERFRERGAFEPARPV